MKTFKKNLPEGVKKQFALYKGVKVRLINKNTKFSINFDKKDENPSFFDKINYLYKEINVVK